MDHRDVDERMLVGDATEAGTKEETAKEGWEKSEARGEKERSLSSVEGS